MTTRQLPLVERNGKKYFLDERLRELRNVDNPHDYINYWGEKNVWIIWNNIRRLHKIVWRSW